MRNIDYNYIIHKYWEIEEEFSFLQNSDSRVYYSDNYVARFSRKNPRKSLEIIEALNNGLEIIKSKSSDLFIYKDDYYCTIYKRIHGNTVMEESFDVSLAEEMADKIVALHENIDAGDEYFPTLDKLEYITRREELWGESYRGLENYIDSYNKLEKKTLIHGDLHLKNILRDNKGKLVIFDYDDLRWGTLEEELSIHLFYIKYLSVELYNSPKTYNIYKENFLSRIEESFDINRSSLKFYEDFRHIETYLWFNFRYDMGDNIPEEKQLFYDTIKKHLDSLLS